MIFFQSKHDPMKLKIKKSGKQNYENDDYFEVLNSKHDIDLICFKIHEALVRLDC